MDRFYASPSGRSDEPWFRLGTVDVTTTVLLCGLSVISMFVWAANRRAVELLRLSAFDVRRGQVWRVVTCPIANAPSLSGVLAVVMLYLFGREIERSLGRSRYLWFTGTLVVLPSLFATALGLDFGGLFLLETGLFVAFIATYPTAMGFFGIPLWVFGAVFIGIQVLQLTGERQWDWLAVLALIVGLAMLLARSFGLSPLDWIPRIPLPSFVTGETRRSPASRPGASRPAARGPRVGRRKGEATVTPLRPAGGKEATPSAADLLRQAEIDVLLDKINEHGIGSLTPEERRRLDDHSRRLREERGG